MNKSKPHSSTNHTDNCRINPLQPNISMYILFTVLCTLPRVSLVGDHFLYSRDLYVYFKDEYDFSLGSTFAVCSLEKYQLFG